MAPVILQILTAVNQSAKHSSATPSKPSPLISSEGHVSTLTSGRSASLNRKRSRSLTRQHNPRATSRGGGVMWLLWLKNTHAYKGFKICFRFLYARLVVGFLFSFLWIRRVSMCFLRFDIIYMYLKKPLFNYIVTTRPCYYPNFNVYHKID